MKTRLPFLLRCVALWLWATAALAVPPGHAYTVAVVPQFNVQQIYEAWQPLLDRISRETGMTFKLRFYPSIPEFEKGVEAGQPDFAFVNPYHALIARNTQGYRPLLRDSKPLVGILVVAANSGVRRLADLEGKTIVFPAPNAYAASLLTRAALTDAGIHFQSRYVLTHSNVYRHVVLGYAVAGGGALRTLAAQTPEISGALRILYQTPGSPSHPIVAHPRVPESDCKAFTQAVLDVAHGPAGRGLLKAAGIPDPVPADFERDYRPLERLHLERYALH